MNRNCFLIFTASLVTAVGALSQGSSTPQASSQRQSPSSLLRPALNQVAQAGSAVDLNRWKGPNTLREEVDANLASMQKDLQTTLPPLLDAADASPDSAAASLPVLLNLDALYSVLLRVSLAARASAPRDQNTQLEQAASLLDTARRELGDAVLTTLKAQEQRTADLQAALQQTTTPAPPVAPSSPAKTKKRSTPARSAADH
ncbi:MAG: hypothetical protein ACRYF4_07840 [Janthinobacterium lividum]